MAFLQDQTVIHIKLTDKGRELLSRGKLTFTKFAIGDSEIDYEYNLDAGLDSSNAIVLRPFDNNPDIVSFITEDVDGDIYTELPAIANTTTTITNTIEQKGMFNVTSLIKKLYDDPAHVKQANMKIITSNVSGGTSLTINQSSLYIGGSPEPIVGDYILIKWTNQFSTASTIGFNVNIAVAYLFYKIISIDSGSLSGDDLVVTVDRELPNYSGMTISYNSGALLYPNNNGRKILGDSIQNYYGAPFVTDFVTEAMLAFIENYDTPTIEVPIWNMTIVFTENIIGIDPLTYRGFGKNPSVEFGGMVKYLQKINPTVKNIGIIHYTNFSPSNNYGEGLGASPSSTPILNMPTIMWHKNIGTTIGITLNGDYDSISTLPQLNTTYMNLVDQFGNVVGKVFTDLKIFIIEDQELLFAMSYKSNRNWTLPKISSGFNSSLCVPSDVEISDVILTE